MEKGKKSFSVEKLVHYLPINLLWIISVNYFVFRREKREKGINLNQDLAPRPDHQTSTSQGSSRP